ncbi:MAG: hypothetical protein WAU62_02020 [Dehalococcoidales bacterium]|jgi:serine O-acetyltransferase
MITSKQDYAYYLEADRIALERKTNYGLEHAAIRKFIVPDYVWDFEKLLRKVEYLKNCGHGPLGRIHYANTLREYMRFSLRLGYYIHPNNFGPGLRISHPGYILIAPEAKIGPNCYINPGSVIGISNETDRAPNIGANVYIGPGVKIYGPIEIADNIAIGANSVVNRSFIESGITIAGNPARKISNKGSIGLLIKATDVISAHKQDNLKIEYERFKMH